MATALYLAMKEEEFVPLVSSSVKSGWLDCNFSCFNRGLDQLPTNLPLGSLLILTDRLPFRDHDPDLIVQQLCRTVTSLNCAALLLDFEQPAVPELKSLAANLTSTLPCPVVISSLYAKDIDCSVFLPPCPHHVHLADHIAPWAGRDIWLDIARNTEIITVTTSGSETEVAPWSDPPYREHTDKNLHCHYHIEVGTDRVRFTLRRTKDDMNALLRDAEILGIRNFVGLYQEWEKK